MGRQPVAHHWTQAPCKPSHHHPKAWPHECLRLAMRKSAERAPETTTTSIGSGPERGGRFRFVRVSRRCDELLSCCRSSSDSDVSLATRTTLAFVRCERLPATCYGTPANKCHDISASLRPATLRQKEALDVRGLAGKRRGGRRLVEPRQLSAAFLDRPSSRCCPSI